MKNLIEEFGGVIITTILFVGVIGALWSVMVCSAQGFI